MFFGTINTTHYTYQQGENMTSKDYCQFIENYIKNDRTGRAIMLTAPWGSGKSYFIKNKLSNYLKEKKLQYVVVSLYGLKEIKEINKELFLEINLQKSSEIGKCIFKHRQQIVNGIIGVGRTILKQLINVNIDFSLKEPNYDKLYQSVNLKNRLVIFEDLERSSVDIIEFMGYVNNIVERDGIKVLLVANEAELVVYSTDGNEQQILTKESQKYLKIKEKTVGDTIHFYSDYFTSIEDIIRLYKNGIFEKMLKEKDLDGTTALVRRVTQNINVQEINYRSLLVACQKMFDFIGQMTNVTPNDSFIESIFIGLIVYMQKRNNGDQTSWSAEGLTSPQLGSSAYPLWKVIYNFTEKHVFNQELYLFSEDLFLKEKERSDTDESLQVLYSFFLQEEINVKQAIDVVYEKLKTNRGVRPDDYLRIANYLIAIKSAIGYEAEIENCLNLMIDNARAEINKGHTIHMFISSGMRLDSQKEMDEFSSFENKLKNVIESNRDKLLNFKYTPEGIEEYYNSIYYNNAVFSNSQGFAVNLDIDKLLEIIPSCTAQQLHTLRSIFLSIYGRTSNITDFGNDTEYLVKIRDGVNKLINTAKTMDAIKTLQLKWFCANLDDAINKLSKVV